MNLASSPTRTQLLERIDEIQREFDDLRSSTEGDASDQIGAEAIQQIASMIAELRQRSEAVEENSEQETEIGIGLPEGGARGGEIPQPSAPEKTPSGDAPAGTPANTANWVILAIVRDTEGQLAAGVEVRLSGPAGMSMASDSRGEARFEISGPGRYMIQAFTEHSESSPAVFNETNPSEGYETGAELALMGAPTEPFEPPTEAGQPTLRKGDEDADGWVEYLQKLLNVQLGNAGQTKVAVNGKFDSATDAAVRLVQGASGCSVDGIVGNQTWSALREDEVLAAVGTDGREPGSHSEEGSEARWGVESRRLAIYEESLDAMRFSIASVGTEPIEGFNVDIFVDGARQHLVIGAPAKETAGQAMHVVLVTRFKERFGPGPYEIEAYLPQELGGDKWASKVDLNDDGTDDETGEDDDSNNRATADSDGRNSGGSGRGSRSSDRGGKGSESRGGEDSASDVTWRMNVLVKGDDGRPVEGATVRFRGDSGASEVTDARGEATHKVRGAGRYRITAERDGVKSKTETVEESNPRSGTAHDVELTLKSAPVDAKAVWTINVTVTWANGDAAANTAVHFKGKTRYDGLTDYNGQETHAVIGPGKFKIHAIKKRAGQVLTSPAKVVEEKSPQDGFVRNVRLVLPPMDATPEAEA